MLISVSQSGIDITEFAARCPYGHSQLGIDISEKLDVLISVSQSGIDISEKLDVLMSVSQSGIDITE